MEENRNVVDLFFKIDSSNQRSRGAGLHWFSLVARRALPDQNKALTIILNWGYFVKSIAGWPDRLLCFELWNWSGFLVINTVVLLLLQIDRRRLCRNAQRSGFLWPMQWASILLQADQGVAVQSVRAVDQAVINAGGFWYRCRLWPEVACCRKIDRTRLWCGPEVNLYKIVDRPTRDILDY